jgi:general secretion pathway protein M
MPGAEFLPEGRRGRWLAVGVTLGGFTLLWCGGVLPLVGSYADGVRALDARSALQERMAQRAQTVPQLRRDLEQRARSGSADASLLAAASDTLAAAALQEMLQAMATHVGASLASVETMAVLPVGGYRQIGLHVSLIASWPVLIRLLAAVAQAQPNLLVDDLRLHNGLSDAADPPMNATFTVHAFRRAEGEGS